MLPHGPVTTDGRSLYQELHDRESDDTRTCTKAVLEQQRTNTLPWMMDDYDGDPNPRDVYTIDAHDGYAGVAALPPPSREDNKEWRRFKYRLGQDVLLAERKLDGSIKMLREPNVLSLRDGTTFTPKDEPTRLTCVRALECFEKDGRTIKYTRFGDVFCDGDVEMRYRNGLVKRINRSVAVEIDGVLRGLVERGELVRTHPSQRRCGTHESAPLPQRQVPGEGAQVR